MIVLDSAAPPPKHERPATRVLHDEPNLRVIAFHLRPGQAVPPHHDASTVLVQVVSAPTSRLTSALGRVAGESWQSSARSDSGIRQKISS